MSRRSGWVAAALVMLVASAAEAKPRKYSWEISPFVGSRDYDKSLDGLSTHGVGGVRLGYNLTRKWELETSYSFDQSNHDRTLFRRNIDIEDLQLGAVRNFNTGPDEHETYGRWISWDRWIPYVTAGFGHFSADDSQLGARTSNTFFFGGGTRIMTAPFVGIRFDVRNVSSMDDKDFGESFSNLEASVGASFILGGQIPRDSDGDGVVDGIDKCPGTPLGCWVDEVGCPRDEDADGVCDGLDRCPNTPAGCPVDEHGCPLDEDGDGVCDGLDNCPGTPAGCWVDDKGCPRDSDKDGVCDGIDRCPDTPEGARVDAQGCPLDSDGDGVADGLDQCPDTPRGVRVDARGCPIAVVRLLLANVHFEFNKSDIRPFYKGVLDEVAKSLLQDEYRVLEIELRGHTDAIDSVEYNYRLGQARADSVKEYLVARGVAPGRLVTKSYSELEPAASNTKPDGSDDPAGRAMNRRVEMVPTTAVPAGATQEIKILVPDTMFDRRGSALTDEGRSYLEEIARGFAGDAFSDVRFTVTGRAAGRNSGELSRQRAEAAAAHLESLGIDRARMDIRAEAGAGDSVIVTPGR